MEEEPHSQDMEVTLSETAATLGVVIVEWSAVVGSLH